jgi:hypothetical protein
MHPTGGCASHRSSRFGDAPGQSNNAHPGVARVRGPTFYGWGPVDGTREPKTQSSLAAGRVLRVTAAPVSPPSCRLAAAAVAAMALSDRNRQPRGDRDSRFWAAFEVQSALPSEDDRRTGLDPRQGSATVRKSQTRNSVHREGPITVNGHAQPDLPNLPNRF